MFILLLLLLPLLLTGVGEEFDSPIANSQIKHHYFQKKPKQHLNAGRYPARITACCT